MTRGRLYFAYGANLASHRLRGRCPGASCEGPALLASHRLAFAGESLTWGAGVATVEPAPGESVPGVLYRLSGENFRRLDRFEGVPSTYERREVTVDKGGTGVTAVAYVRRQAVALSPSSAYFAALAAGYDEHALPPASLDEALARAAAITREGHRRGRLLFVYGTLMRAERLHEVLSRQPYLGPARTHDGYLLHHLGSCPALVRASAGIVAGELYWVDDDSLARIDAIEGHPDLYQREEISLVDGSRAFAYLMDAAACAEAPVVACGDWRTRDGA